MFINKKLFKYCLCPINYQGQRFIYVYIYVYIYILIYIKKNKGIARKKNLYINDG